MVLMHFMPKERLTWPYALRLMGAMGQTSIILELYLMALNRPPFRNRPGWKRGWPFAALVTARRLLPIILGHPWECWRRPEGSIAALDFERESARWATLCGLFGRYAGLRDEIARTTQARAGSGRLATTG